MNYSPIANPEVKLCLPSATVTEDFFFRLLTGKLEEPNRERRRKVIDASSDNCVFVTEESMRADKALPGSSGHCRLAYTVTWAFSKQPQQTRCSGVQGRGVNISQGTCLKLCFHFFFSTEG